MTFQNNKFVWHILDRYLAASCLTTAQSYHCLEIDLIFLFLYESKSDELLNHGTKVFVYDVSNILWRGC